MTLQQLLAEFFQKQRATLAVVAPGRNFAYWEEVAVQNPPLTISASDIVQVWSNQDNLDKVFKNTPAQVIISWSQNVYMDCGYGNMFGDRYDLG